jgi:hypothetical protein
MLQVGASKNSDNQKSSVDLAVLIHERSDFGIGLAGA